MQLKAKQEFAWAHNGHTVEAFVAGQVFTTENAELIEVSIGEGWAEEVKAHKSAPENKAKAKRCAPSDAEKP